MWRRFTGVDDLCGLPQMSNIFNWRVRYPELLLEGLLYAAVVVHGPVIPGSWLWSNFWQIVVPLGLEYFDNLLPVQPFVTSREILPGVQPGILCFLLKLYHFSFSYICRCMLCVDAFHCFYTLIREVNSAHRQRWCLVCFHFPAVKAGVLASLYRLYS